MLAFCRRRTFTVGMEQSAQWDPARAGGEFFADPQHATHRRYEALRAYCAARRSVISPIE